MLGDVEVRLALGMLVSEDKVVQIISRQMASNHSLLFLLALTSYKITMTMTSRSLREGMGMPFSPNGYLTLFCSGDDERSFLWNLDINLDIHRGQVSRRTFCNIRDLMLRYWVASNFEPNGSWFEGGARRGNITNAGILRDSFQGIGIW